MIRSSRRAGRGHGRRSASPPATSAAAAAGAAERRASIWPHVEERIVDLIEAHRSTIVFANSRRLAERLTARLNEIAERAQPRRGPRPASASRCARTAGRRPVAAQAGLPAAPSLLARAHHGSVSREQRAHDRGGAQGGAAAGGRRDLSLELGIDMGAVDLVIQVESPPSVASGLQRIGRAGHQVGAVSRGVMFPKYRGDLRPVRRRRRADGGGRSRRCATRATRSTCSRSRSSPWSRWIRGRSTSVRRAGPPRGAVRRAARAGARGGARHARRALPERRVRRAAAAAGLGPGHRRR